MLLVYLLLVLINDVHSRNNQYIGEQVIRLTPKTQNALNHLKGLIKNFENSVWAEGNQINKSYILEIRKSKIEQIRSFCRSRNIEMQVAIADLKSAIDDTYKTEHFGWFNYSMYNRFSDIKDELNKLKYKFQHLMKMDHIGHSFEGRPLLQVHVTQSIKNNAERNKKGIIWIESGSHGREWISIAVGVRLINLFLTGYGSNTNITKLLQKYEFVFIPVFNPDGYEFTWTNDRLWRKTRSFNKNTTCRGVDPNRNWNIKFGEPFSSNDPCSINYRGPNAESENCVYTYAKVMRKVRGRIIAYFSLHSFLQLFLIPYSYTFDLPPSFHDNVNIGNAFKRGVARRYQTDFQTATIAFALAPPEPGVSVDYVHDVLKVNASYTIELRDRVKYMFLLPADQIEPSSLETFDGLVDAINEIEKVRKRNMVTLNITQKVTNSKNNKHKHTFKSFLWTIFYFIKKLFQVITSHIRTLF